MRAVPSPNLARLAILALLALLAAVPLVGGLGLLNVTIKIFIASVFALGFNLLWGQAGLLSFGHAAYFALGTFGAIFAMRAIEAGSAFPTPLVPLAGAATGFAFGLVAGWFATIRSGVYFAMITVALAELVAAVAVKWDAVFGGEGGVLSVRSPFGPFALQSTQSVYYLVLAWSVAVLAFLYWLGRSPWGLVLRGIREREERVRFLGYDSHAVKTLAFALSAGISGLAGGLLALSDETANMVLFQGTGSAFVVLNTVIGGAGVLGGPVVGAAITTLFGYYAGAATHFWLLYLGVLFIALMLFAPQGLAGLACERAAAVRRGERPWLTGAEARGLAGLVLLMLGAVLATEIVGALFDAGYAARAAGSPGAWPPVRVFGIDWRPFAPTTLLAVVLLLAAGIALLRRASPPAGLRRLLLRPEPRP